MTTSEKNESKSNRESSKKSVKAVSVNTSDDASKESAEQRQKQLDVPRNSVKSSVRNSARNSVSNHIRWKLFNKSIKAMLLARGETWVEGWRVPIRRNDQQLTVIVVHQNTRETKQVFSFNELKLAGLWKAPGKRKEARKRPAQQSKQSKLALVSAPLYTGHL